MKLSFCWALLPALTSSVIAQDSTTPPKSFPSSIILSYELLTSSGAAKPLAKIDYNPKSLAYTLSSWTPPLDAVDTLQSTSQEPTSAPLVRVLLPNGSSSVTSLESFSSRFSQDINVWIHLDGSVLSASVLSRTPPPVSAEEEALRQKEDRLRKRGKPVPSRPKPTKAKAKKGEKPVEVREVEAGPVVKVNLLVAGEGPQPKWNTRAPVQIDADGKEIEPEQVVEKTFFQKYWYIILAIGFLIMSGGGAGGS